jgi:hypothetical protein
VAHLAERLRGAEPSSASWPDRLPLTRDERKELQRRLAARGHPVKDFEGRIDLDLRDTIRIEQSRLGMLPDGYPTKSLLDALMAGSTAGGVSPPGSY